MNMLYHKQRLKWINQHFSVVMIVILMVVGKAVQAASRVNRGCWPLCGAGRTDKLLPGDFLQNDRACSDEKPSDPPERTEAKQPDRRQTAILLDFLKTQPN